MRIVACSDPHSRRLGMLNVFDVDKIRGHIHFRIPVECMFGGRKEKEEEEEGEEAEVKEGWGRCL
jgi:hypothetical protein